MDKKSKILIAVLLVLILASVGYTFYKIMIKRDYVISAQVDCDPYEEKCFIWECDPESSEEGEACTGDPEEDIWYYQIVKRNAANIPNCDPNDENCDALTCDPVLEKDCEIILCDEKTAAEQEAKCNDPAEYTLENPVEEEDLSAEEAECDPESDEECVIKEEGEGEEDLTDESADLSEEE